MVHGWNADFTSAYTTHLLVSNHPARNIPSGGAVLTQVTPESARFEHCDNRSQQLDFGPMLRPYGH